MSVRFAPARRATRSPIARILTRVEVGPVANDHDAKGQFMSDPTKAALRHFAEHGLRAVPIALDNAGLAHAAAHQEDLAYWLDICRELDAGSAARFEASHGLIAHEVIG